KDLYIDLFTESTDAINVSWKLKSTDLPSGWELTICDNAQCIGDPKLDTEYGMAPFKNGDETFFKVTLDPKGKDGTGAVTLLIYDKDDEANGKEAVFILNAGPVSVREVPSVDVNVYPNPARDHIKINFSSTPKKEVNIKVFNLLGQEQKNVALSQEKNEIKIDISLLKNGNYLLQFIDEKGALNTHRFTKRM
ncbi:MAG: T9SS type A sorting domain-containing protein, partial [Bacteroidetes bacterium]|nr:T9SS type A sorting domain-containing protein [Bacteroidota bacterium]